MVEVFKTNVTDDTKSERLVKQLSELFPAFKINFDLSDCDKILRVEGISVEQTKIVEVLHKNGFHCEALV